MLNTLFGNFTNPALLFFFLGLIAVQIKSDLSIPKNSSKFISIYLLFAIGFKGGQELSHSNISGEIIWSVLLGILSAVAIPLLVFFIVKRKTTIQNAGAIAAAYGSVSAVTFITTISYLDSISVDYGGHLVAVMALMEAPAIVVGVLLIRLFEKDSTKSLKQGIIHSFTNGSVVLIIGSLVIGYLASESQAEGIKPFTTDIFKGFLAVFLLDMGIQSGKKIKALLKNGISLTLMAIIFPVINGVLMALLSGLFIESTGNRLLLTLLAASASYIAVPAAMRMSAPKANPGIYVPMALAITFPINVILGIPFYHILINNV